MPTLPHNISPHLTDTVPISTSHDRLKVLAGSQRHKQPTERWLRLLATLRQGKNTLSSNVTSLPSGKDVE